MPIQGLTDAVTRQAKKEAAKKKPAIEIAKGHRQRNGKMGGDLEDKLRLTVNYAPFTPILKKFYGTPNKDGDFIIDAISVYLPYDDIDRVCPTTMASYGKSGFKLACDRVTITKRVKEERNEQGIFRQLIDVNEPCPVAGKPLPIKCQYKCVRQAKLHVHVKEIFDSGYMSTAVIDFGGIEDLGDAGILAQLEEWQEELGSLTASPFYWEIERGDGTGFVCDRVPFILSRRKVNQKKPVMEGDKYNPVRTGNNFIGLAWILDIQPDPEWMEKYRLWQYKQKQAAQLRQSGFQLRPGAIAGLLHSSTPFNPNDVILEAEVSVVEDRTSPELLNADTQTLEVSEFNSLVSPRPAEKKAKPNAIALLMTAFEQNGWTQDAIAALQKHYQIKNWESINDAQRMELQFLAMNHDAAREWNTLALSPGTVTVMPPNLTKEDWAKHIHPVCLKHGWVKVRPNGEADNTRIVAMLQSEYGITRISELLVTQITEILDLITSEEVRDRWLHN